jgi:hypothetical protein
LDILAIYETFKHSRVTGLRKHVIMGIKMKVFESIIEYHEFNFKDLLLASMDRCQICMFSRLIDPHPWIPGGQSGRKYQLCVNTHVDMI